MEEKEKEDRQILLNYYNDLSEKSSYLLERQTDLAYSVDEHSTTFSQFLVSICAGLLAIFFSVKDFNVLILNQHLFGLAVLVYFSSFLLYIFYSKEKIDYESSSLAKAHRQSEANFKESYEVLEKQFKKGINIDTFYRDIEELSKNNEQKSLKNKEYPSYFLEFFTFCFISSLWLLFLSTQNIKSLYLFLGLIVIFFITNNQYRLIFKLINTYSKFINKIFPLRD